MSARRLAVALVAATSMASFSAFAASSSVVSDTLASGSEPVVGCDTTPEWTYEFVKNSDGKVSAVTVQQIAGSCNGGALTVNVQPGASSGSATITGCADPCSQTIQLDTPLVPDAVDEVDAIILGP